MPTIPCGSVIQRSGATNQPGVAGCLVQFPGDPQKLFWLTAGHVLVSSDAAQFVDPVEAADLPGQTIGRLFAWTGLDGPVTVDAALVWMDPKLVSPQIQGFGAPQDINPLPDLNAKLRIFVGGKEHVGFIEHLGPPVAMTVTYPDFSQNITFQGQIICTGFEGVDADGAIAVDDSDLIVGMVVGRGTVAGIGQRTVITPIEEIFNHRDWGLGDPLQLVTTIPATAVPPPAPATSGTPDDALRTAMRFNEIGNDTPYRLYFAKKGKSGASFGFTQGDLAAGQAVVQATFGNVLAAAGIPDNQITSRLSVRGLTQDPLDSTEKEQVNNALDSPSGRPLVDAMDEIIFRNVCRELDQCVAAAESAGRVIDPKAQIYMLLWINMTGEPTDLLKWLTNQPFTLAGKPNPVEPPGKTVTVGDIENYLNATEFFSENQRNFDHLQESVAKGAALLEGTTQAGGSGSGGVTGIGRSGSGGAASAGVPRLSAARNDVDLHASPAIEQLVAVVGEATKSLSDGFSLVVTSTFRPGSIVANTGGVSQHARGNAIDVQIIDPQRRPIPNKGEDHTGLYLRLAIAAFHANENMFPERRGQLAWGGNFTTGGDNAPRDLMHFDYRGDRGRFGTLAQEARKAETGSA